MSESNDAFEMRPAEARDQESILKLMPMLADFDVPGDRNPDDLWMSDADLVREHFSQAAPKTRLIVVSSGDDLVLGFALISIGEEPLSHAPNAHLEAIVVAPEGRGMGLGRRLMAATERVARDEGVRSVTLHALSKNRRARNLNESLGFDGELLRYIKRLSD